MKVENWALGKIKPYDKNAKLHNVDWIKKSIQDFQIDQPIVVDGEGVIIKGHGRLKAAQELGLKSFPVVIRTDLTEDQLKLARIVDNRSAEAGWDSTLLAEEVAELVEALPDIDLDDFGVSEGWLDELFAEDLPVIDLPVDKGEGSESTTITQNLHLKFGKYNMVMTEDEFDLLERRYLSFLKEKKTDFGFVHHLLEEVMK